MRDDAEETVPTLRNISIQWRGTGKRRRALENELVQESDEAEIIDRVAVEQALMQLDPWDRALIVMAFAYERPEDYDGRWPARGIDIATYLCEHHPLAWPRRRRYASRVSERLGEICAQWERGGACIPSDQLQSVRRAA